MALPQTLDHSGWQLRADGAPWLGSRLHRLGVAVYAAQGLDSEDAGHELVWDAVLAVDQRATVRRALEQAGVDVAAVQAHLREIDRIWTERRNAAEFDLERRIARAEDATRRGAAVSR